jgi:NAD(P)H-flavin reductase
VAIVRISLFARETFARVCAAKKFGIAIAARIAIIATTINNSIKVNPVTLYFGFRSDFAKASTDEISDFGFCIFILSHLGLFLDYFLLYI